MREILFRGKKLNTGEWIYGNVCIIYERYYSIIDKKDGRYWVDPSTVGQYTGLSDKKGVKIFEGDIIRKLCPVYKLGAKAPAGYRLVFGVVSWDEEDKSFPGTWAMLAKDEYGNPAKYGFTKDFEVIGNIYDNPELLEVQS